MYNNNDSEERTVFNLTCLSCQVAFLTSDLQRAHFKTDWHRYNLKRKIASLPPVSLENFNDRLKAQAPRSNMMQGELPDNSAYTDIIIECTACRKSYSSENAWNNHLKSKKHKEIVRETNKTDSDVKRETKRQIPTLTNQSQSNNTMSEEQFIDEKIARSRKLDIEECIFCSERSISFDENMEHMEVKHGFFVPDIEFLVDLYGLCEYLGEKVSVGNICLACNGKGRAFHTLEAVQKHMLDKGHCRIAYGTPEADEEFAEFYDFSILDDVEEELDIEEEENSDDTEMKDSANNDVAPPHIEPLDDFELVLPSGTRIGHRALRRYYKQRLTSQTKLNNSSMRKLMGRYQALGWTGDFPLEKYEGDRVAQLAVKQQMNSTKRAIAKELRKRQLTDLKIGGHHNHQPHFRYQIL